MSRTRDEVVQLLSRHPLLRYGLSGTTIADYVRSKPNNWRQENFVSDLAIQRLREERRWSSYVQKTIASKELFAQRKSYLLRRVSDTYRDALAEYIVHRKAVIEIADQLRGAYDFDETWGKKGLFKYHDDFDIFIEILGFDKLISDAEKRNATFFEILLNDLGS
jgi:hypothetical protein